MFRSIGKQSKESMELVLRKKIKATVGRIFRKGSRFSNNAHNSTMIMLGMKERG